ncbi:hypothetical protein Tco_0081555, partial [Tanacetum coccineum]
VALEIVKKYPKLGTSGNVLGILARKPEAFPDAEPSITGRTINPIKRLYSFMSITHQPYRSKHPETGTETVSAENYTITHLRIKTTPFFYPLSLFIISTVAL